MQNNQEFATALRLGDFRETTPIETSPLDGLVLTVPDTIIYHRGVKAKLMPMDVTVECDGGIVSFYGPGKAIELMLEIDELRAIMRLFDVAESDEGKEE